METRDSPQSWVVGNQSLTSYESDKYESVVGGGGMKCPRPPKTVLHNDDLANKV